MQAPKRQEVEKTACKKLVLSVSGLREVKGRESIALVYERDKPRITRMGSCELSCQKFSYSVQYYVHNPSSSFHNVSTPPIYTPHEYDLKINTKLPGDLSRAGNPRRGVLSTCIRIVYAVFV